MSRLFTLAILGTAILAARSLSAADAETLFTEKVRPLLEAKCFECHSSKAMELKGNLKLDSLDGIFRGGDNGPSVVAGDIENSFLLRALRYQEADYQMPPAGRLSDEDIALVETWVKLLKVPTGKSGKRTMPSRGR